MRHILNTKQWEKYKSEFIAIYHNPTTPRKYPCLVSSHRDTSASYEYQDTIDHEFEYLDVIGNFFK